MIFVLDASAAVEVSLLKKNSKIISKALTEAEWVVAPDIFISEVTQVFWKYHQFENLQFSFCEESLQKTVQLVDNFKDSKDLYQEAFSMACQTGLTVYDTLYLILARRNNGILLTLDKKLNRIAKKNSVRCFN